MTGMTDQELAECEEIVENGFADVPCGDCGEDWRIEPDAGFDCYCGNRIESALVTHGLI